MFFVSLLLHSHCETTLYFRACGHVRALFCGFEGSTRVFYVVERVLFLQKVRSSARVDISLKLAFSQAHKHICITCVPFLNEAHHIIWLRMIFRFGAVLGDFVKGWNFCWKSFFVCTQFLFTSSHVSTRYVICHREFLLLVVGSESKLQNSKVATCWFAVAYRVRHPSASVHSTHNRCNNCKHRYSNYKCGTFSMFEVGKVIIVCVRFWHKPAYGWGKKRKYEK